MAAGAAGVDDAVELDESDAELDDSPEEDDEEEEEVDEPDPLESVL